MKPTVLGIGAQKSASSWLRSVLGVHPQIGIADPIEVDFFSHHFDRGYQWYERHFSHLSDMPARCDASSSYFHDPRAAARAWEYNPDLKIIALLRDPVERAFASHLKEVRQGHIAPQSFEEGLRNNPGYLEQGLYHTHLARWADCFGPEQLLVLIAEEIYADPVSSAARVYNFLKVKTTFVSGGASDQNKSNSRLRAPGLRAALHSGGDVMRRAGLEEQLDAAQPFAGLLRPTGTDISDQIPSMLDATRQQLVTYFAPEVVDLAMLLKRQSLPWPTWESAINEQVPPVAV